MKLEYTASVLRGWPGEGARERTEMVTQGAILVNGDVVEAQIDGTVNKVSATPSKHTGLVIRGNGDSSSAANAQGVFMTPQPAKTITGLAWAAGALTATVTNHGYAVGNIVTIAGTVSDANSVTIPGTYVVASLVDANNFTVALAANPGAITLGSDTVTLQSTAGTSGSALVLWGNFIVQTSNYAAGAYVPGSPVTSASGKYQLANGTTDPEVGFVLRVLGASATQTASIVAVIY